MITRRIRAPKLKDLFEVSEPGSGSSENTGSASDLPKAKLRRMDRRLATMGRAEGRLYLELGEVLERFSRLGGPRILGYSSRGYYAVQTLGRGARWAGDLCALARTVESLPLIRAALASGLVGRSMARLLAKHATADSEAELLLQSQGRTVRAVAELLKACANDADDADDADAARSTIETTVPVSDAWAYEFVRILLNRGLGCRTRDEVVEAMLAEGALTLDLLDPSLGVPVGPPAHPAAAWRHERAQADAEIEAELEHRLELGVDVELDSLPPLVPLLPIASLSDDIYVLHAQLEKLAAALASRDLSLGKLAARFWQADGWRRLGFTSDRQYARDRVGCSLSSLQQRMRLARNIDRMPELKTALLGGTVGLEATMLVLRTRRPEFAAAWVARAKERTVMDLREEVEIAETHAHLHDCASYLAPPSDEAIAEYQEARASVLSGKAFRPPCEFGEPGAKPNDEVEGDVQMFVTPETDPPRRGSGMRTLRLSLPDEMARWWRQLEQKWRRASCGLDLGATFVEFLCRATVDTWRGSIEMAQSVKYARIYARAGYRCESPVCGRHDVTPHHLRFRSRQGGDEDSNLAALCVACHLDLLHGGFIAAEPPAGSIRWRLGRVPQMEVLGRAMTTLKKAS